VAISPKYIYFQNKKHQFFFFKIADFFKKNRV